MSLDVSLTATRPTQVFEANITHNLWEMAQEAGIYKCLWRPDEIGITEARQLIQPLSDGLADMRARPEHFKKFNAVNGWGTYDQFIPWIENYLAACEKNPDAAISICR